MIQNITFENFRALKRLELPELSPITLLTGRNNAGKSSILEGFFLMSNPCQPDLFAGINRLRFMPSSRDNGMAWEDVFYHLDSRIPMKLSVRTQEESAAVTYVRDDGFIPKANWEQDMMYPNGLGIPGKRPYALRYEFQGGLYSESGWFCPGSKGMSRVVEQRNGAAAGPLANAWHISAYKPASEEQIAEWCGQSLLDGKKDTVLTAMKIIEPEIQDYITISRQGTAEIYVNLAGKMIPAKLAGDGTIRLLQIVLCMLSNPGAVILIDEAETGFHYSIMEKLWNVLATAAKESGCQVIATTHSYECIQSAVDGIGGAGMEDNFCLYRVERHDGENRAFRLDGELVRYSVDANMEVR